jgi:arylsulfatase
MASEGGTRVAAFAYHPAMAESSSIDNQYLSVMDVMPTLLDLAEAEFDPTKVRGREVVPMNGKSFRRVLEGSVEPVHPPDEVIAGELHGQRTLRRGSWKLVWEQQPPNIWWDDEPEADWQTWRLYNLADDPTEQHDRAEAEPEILDELVDLWHEYARDNNVMESVTPYWPEPRGQ